MVETPEAQQGEVTYPKITKANDQAKNRTLSPASQSRPVLRSEKGNRY